MATPAEPPAGPFQPRSPDEPPAGPFQPHSPDEPPAGPFQPHSPDEPPPAGPFEPRSPSHSPQSPPPPAPLASAAAAAAPAPVGTPSPSDLSYNPTIGSFQKEKGVTSFVIGNVHTSVVNALRRTILGHLPLLAIVPFPETDTTVRITTNTTPLHNELLKQRLAAIDFHLDPDDPLADRLQMRLRVDNTTDDVRIVTVADVELWDTVADKQLEPAATRAILPPDPLTGDHAILVVLRPPVGSMPGDMLELTATMRKMTSTANGMYTLASVCSMGNVVDKDAMDAAWKADRDTDGTLSRALWEETVRGKFDVPDAFTFRLRAVRWLDEAQLLIRGLQHMQTALTALAEKGESGTLNVTKVRDVLAPNTFDVEIPGDTYAVGHCLRHQLYEMATRPGGLLSVVGFDKQHAHDKHGSLRMIFRNDASAVNASHLTARAARGVAEIYDMLLRQVARTGSKRTNK